MSRQIPIEPATLAEVCSRHRIRKLSLFGSMLKGTARPDSDVDLLVDETKTLSYFDRFDLEDELERRLRVRAVDVCFEKNLNPHIRDAALRDARAV